MVTDPENGSQGHWLKELRRSGLEEKKARGAGRERLAAEQEEEPA